jgi:hypothetical protein
MEVRAMPHFQKVENGVTTIKLNDYEDFDYVIREKLWDYPFMIYRGHTDAEWPLRTTLDRLFYKQHKRFPSLDDADSHLNIFKYATRGRLSQGWIPEDNDSWWSLGQHFGLATPLLDWTESPYVAAYFAFSEPSEQNGDAKINRAIYALDPSEVQKKNKDLELHQQVRIIRPLLDQNPRLVNQRGLFTKLPLGNDLETWVQSNFDGEGVETVLIKIIIPASISDREKFLRLLNRKNINPLTLFPDLVGASLHTNNSIFISNY